MPANPEPRDIVSADAWFRYREYQLSGHENVFFAVTRGIVTEPEFMCIIEHFASLQQLYEINA